ncbi:4-alpha-glucanotransferase, partial [Shewanella sp.]
LMMLANHDVPTITAWWTAEDLKLRRKLELIDSDHKLHQLLAQRQLEKQQLIELLNREGALAHPAVENTDELDFDTVILAWLSVVAKGNAQLFSVQLSDLVADKHGVNIPGTWKEFPNWQRRLPLSIQQMSQSAKVQQRMTVIKQSRQTSSHGYAANVSLSNNSKQ